MWSEEITDVVAQMSATVARSYVQKMIVREIETAGSRDRAFENHSRRYGITKSQLRHLWEGRAKTVEAGLFARIRLAYLDFNERQIAKLQNELALERAMGGDPDSLDHLEMEADRLLAKVRAAKTPPLPRT